MTTSIIVVSKQPPGGRCSLYLRYAAVLGPYLGGEVAMCYGDTTEAVSPPALLIGAMAVVPSDGVILSPEDIAASLGHLLSASAVANLTQQLDAAQETWMEEWAGG